MGSVEGSQSSSGIAAEVVADAREILSDVEHWQLTDDAWRAVAQALRTLNERLRAGDNHGSDGAIADLELLAPVRQTPIGSVTRRTGAVPPSVRDLLSRVVHTLDDVMTSVSGGGGPAGVDESPFDDRGSDATDGSGPDDDWDFDESVGDPDQQWDDGRYFDNDTWDTVDRSFDGGPWVDATPEDGDTIDRGGWRVPGDDLDEIPPAMAGPPTVGDRPPPATAAGGGNERAINLWLDDASPGKPPTGDAHGAPLVHIDEQITAHVNVGAIRVNSLIGAAGLVADDDVPEGDAVWHFVISSPTIALAAPAPTGDAVSPAVSIDHAAVDGIERWTAEFDLSVPDVGESATVDLLLTPSRSGEATLQLDIVVSGEPYRRIVAVVDVRDVRADGQDSLEVLDIREDAALTPLAHARLRPSHEWQTPPSRLTVLIAPPNVHLIGEIDGGTKRKRSTWPAAPSSFAGLIPTVRAALDAFRVAHQVHLDSLDAEAIARRLDGYAGPRLGSAIDQPPAWDGIARSDELRRLANAGNQLFNAVFPVGSEIRDLLVGLRPGSRVDFDWIADDDALSHIPWDLMYAGEVPVPGEPVDPEWFLGLRLRIGYFVHPIDTPSKALGTRDDATYAHLLYWGDADNDPTAPEARRHREELERIASPLVVVPDAAQDRRTALLAFLAAPAPSPVGLIYLFCQIKSGDGSNPQLRFGSSFTPDDVFDTIDLSETVLDDQPLVFLNACGTGEADPLLANQLREHFFRRRCRAVVVTEAKVPITFASHFAATFFRFFYRTVVPEPMAAGEAFFLTRRLLWTEFANLGGLLYSYINQYEVFVADPDEVAAQRG